LADSFGEFLSKLVYDVCSDEDEDEKETLPLFQAVERGNFQTVKQYLASGGDAETRNASGHSLLSAAVIHSWPRIVRLLLDSSADPNARDHHGRTPLHHAATHSIDSVKLLLAAGADATARDLDGNSVLGEWSYRADQILIAHGARE
jgi:ankyrin repeat protein